MNYLNLINQYAFDVVSISSSFIIIVTCKYENSITFISVNIIWFYYCLTIQAPMERCSRTF